ncbi:LysR family transcriptional regulator [Marinovum sp.]|uniref:LysR family transcriptional regulator n=1 Tax=Marinovum sp. TaxID=2024839 RepID=UPI002B26806C|nr:LysR family transcriptional regulator [Marinovum sp.]
MTPHHLQTDLNWNLLRMFYMIAREQGITKAAKCLGLSQPSVSNALQKLEAQLACQLVIRDSRQFKLTPRGEQIFTECREIFHSAERISQLVSGTDQERGKVRFQIIARLVSPMIDELLRLYHQQNPSVIFQSEVTDSYAILRALKRGETTIGFCLLTEPLDDLPAVRLFRREFNVFCGPGHRLFGQDSVAHEDLKGEPVISFASTTAGQDLEPLTLVRGGLRLGDRINGLTTDFEELRRMIVAGLGIGILPRRPVEEDIRKGRLWPLRIIGEQIGKDVYLVHAPRETLSPAEQAFVDLARDMQQRFDQQAA